MPENTLKNTKAAPINNYIDNYGLYNVRPVIDGEPSGNDGPILTAYADKLGLPVGKEKLVYSYFIHLPFRPIPAMRLPGKPTPPPSRDTILGWYCLGLITVDDLIAAKWTFSPAPLPERNWLKTAASFILAIGEHRNYLWQKELTHSYRVLFSVPLQDRAFYYRMSGKKVPWYYRAIEWIDKRRKPGNNSSALIRWLKYDIDPGLQVFTSYFGAGHPITLAYAKGLVREQL